MHTTPPLTHCQRCGNSGIQQSRPNGALEFFYHLLGIQVAECLVCGCRNLVYPPGVRHPNQNLNRRRDPRLDVYLPVTFTGECGAGEGLTVDLSTDGCKLCTTWTLPMGTNLRLQLSLKNEPHPLVIERAVVHWVYHTTVGLQFVEIQPPERERLSQLLQGNMVSQAHVGSLMLPAKPSMPIQQDTEKNLLVP